MTITHTSVEESVREVSRLLKVINKQLNGKQRQTTLMLIEANWLYEKS